MSLGLHDPVLEHVIIAYVLSRRTLESVREPAHSVFWRIEEQGLR